MDIHKKANLLPGPCGLCEISKIIVIDFHARNNSIYEGPRGDKKIVLYKNGNHYNVANPAKLPAFVKYVNFCEKCKSFLRIIALILVMIHVTHAYIRNVFGCQMKT